MRDHAHVVERERLSFADASEIDALAEMLGRFERGEIDAEQWRAYRVLRGIYSQRQEGVYMLRVKIPQGIVSAAQLRVLAKVATRYSRGFGQVTTRQDFQLHFIHAKHLEPVLRHLAAAGLTTAGAGGNAVRNVVACPLAGVARDEAFDVTPYAEALTRHFLRHPLASSLPRKFKVAFEGCSQDHVATPIQDLGFRARVRTRGGVATRGFAVTVAGGTSSLCTSGTPLFDFLPASELLQVAEAIVRVFHARGDRKNKQRNRLKFLVRDVGVPEFRRLMSEELMKLRGEGAPGLLFDQDDAREERLPARARLAPLVPAGLASATVVPQRQPGFNVVNVALPQGDAGPVQLWVLADLALAHGDGTVRFTTAGQVLLRWVPDGVVPEVLQRLAAAGLGRSGAAHVLACPGSEVCPQAVTRTRDVARLVDQRLRDTAGSAEAAPVSVRLSGCPNGCSQHHLAAIGLQGGARKVGDRSAPQYFVLAGGGVEDGVARFAKPVGKVPARRVPEAVARLVALYVAERREGERAGEFFAREIDRAKAALGSLEELRPEEALPEDFVEPGATSPFAPDVRDGECAA